MNLGWCDVCLGVASVAMSREFYEKLGFRRVEGDDSEGWAVVTNGDQRLGLYEKKHLAEERFVLNFRDGDVQANCERLSSQGIEIEKGPVVSEEGASAWLRDPDGNQIFLDTGVGETKKE